MQTTAEKIVAKAIELGYEQCGIIKVDAMSGYAEKLQERLERAPASADNMRRFFSLGQVKDQIPWAESIVVTVRQYGKYFIPERLQGMVGKYYLADCRRNQASQDYQDSIAFEKYLLDLGLKVATERSFGLTALRWAAYQAGLGLIRRNNFFYTEHGSWSNLEAFVIDQAMELKQNNQLKPCPENCNRCIEACPSKSLSAPYVMDRLSCVSALNTWGGDDLIHEPNRAQMGAWLYGCDVCQDVCPFNQKQWQNQANYPEMEQINELLDVEKILAMDEASLLQELQPRFWYISPDRIWKWKINALNYILNNYKPVYLPAVLAACRDQNEQVRQMANWVNAECVKNIKP